MKAIEHERLEGGAVAAEPAVMVKFNSYPFACACIGVLRFVASLFNVCSPVGGTKNPATEVGSLYALADAAVDDAGNGKMWFFRLCCLGVEILEETWVSTGADCYMMFPSVQTQAQETIRATLLAMAREKDSGGEDWRRHFRRGSDRFK